MQESWFWKRALTVILLGGCFVLTVHGQTYLGANAVLRDVAEKSAKPGEKNKNGDAVTTAREDLKKFQIEVTNLPPGQAAQGWLDLVDRARKANQEAMKGFMGGQMNQLRPDEVFAALPPPADWSELARVIAGRKGTNEGGAMAEMGLRFLAATLTDDAEGRKREIANLQAKAGDGDPQSAMTYRSLLQQLSQVMLETSDDPEAILASLERRLNAGAEVGINQIQVPNLVSQVGAAKAEAFLRKALVAPGVILSFDKANETSGLAQKLALELKDELKGPQWGLVNSLDAVDLYEAMDKRFGAQTNQIPTTGSLSLPDANLPVEDMSMGEKQTAQIYYLLGLIAKNRAKEAAAQAQKVGSVMQNFWQTEAIKEMERAGYTAALDNFFYELLSQNPALPFWNEYVQLAANAGQTERMLALAKSSASRTDVSENKKAAIRRILYKALFAADEVEEGVQELRRLMTAEPAGQQFGQMQDAGNLGIELARVGQLLQKPEWIQEGTADVKKYFSEHGGDPQFAWTAGAVLGPLEKILYKANQGPEAETILTSALGGMVRTDENQQQGFPGSSGAQALTALAALYHEAGRQQDVVTLLEQSPNWGVGDLSELYNANLGEDYEMIMPLHMPSSALPVPYLAADALIATGRREAAEKITIDLLNRQPGLDRGYELLLALRGTNAIPLLDELFARDQFEERPLIWKAELLRRENKLAEAEKVVRQAIAIDPSDGEEGHGDRMRAYAVLADIREAQGEKKDADFYREVVKAIRVSENADEFYQAGLLKRAIPMYEEGLKHFADAYCIQSRLAIQLSELGDSQGAEEHYRRAYELMPDSFGRVESHCFGCERAFEGERAQGIAEKVFNRLAAERPEKPQVHYLLGYLRMEQERYDEARTNYLAAVRLDTNYLNAWVKLNEVSEHLPFHPTERDEIVFNIVRLDPLQRHSQPGFQHVRNLAGLWEVVAKGTVARPVLSTNLFTLTASAEAIKAKSSDQNAAAMQRAMYYNEREQSASPGQAVGQTALVNFAGQMIIGGYGNMGGDE